MHPDTQEIADLLSFDFDAMDLTGPARRPAMSPADAFDAMAANVEAARARAEARAVTKPVAVEYIGEGAMLVWARTPRGIVKASATPYRDGPALRRAIEAAMAKYPGCDLACCAKRAWL